MTSRVAVALCLLVFLSGPSLASGPSGPVTDTEEKAGATNAPGDPAAASSGDQDGDDTPGEAESDANKPPPIDVHRHRPGACPEGPPCKGDD
jgi:hypothetical protein